MKGVGPFDKVIGGLTWSIMNSAVDVDVDLFFEDESAGWLYLSQYGTSGLLTWLD